MNIALSSDQFKKYAILAGLATAAAVIGADAIAGTANQYGGNAFNSVWNFMVEAMQGSLGKVAAGTMVLVGVIAGIAQQSLMGFATGVGAGVGIYATPSVIGTMVSATLVNAPATTQVLHSISNAL